jgi:esterase/lipase
MQTIHFTSQGETSTGHLFQADPETKRPLAFLFIHGWTGHQNLEAAKALADLGFTSLTYGMRGNGESPGDIAKLSRADYLEDACAAYDYLKQQIGGSTAIGVVGSSFGSYLAVHLSQARPVTCLSLRVPANYPDAGFNQPQQPQIIGGKAKYWWEQTQNASQNQTPAILKDFNGSVQIIEAEKDEVVPHQTVANYLNVANKTRLDYQVMPAAPHRLATPQLSAEYRQLLTSWVKAMAK